MFTDTSARPTAPPLRLGGAGFGAVACHTPQVKLQHGSSRRMVFRIIDVATGAMWCVWNVPPSRPCVGSRPQDRFGTGTTLRSVQHDGVGCTAPGPRHGRLFGSSASGGARVAVFASSRLSAERTIVCARVCRWGRSTVQPGRSALGTACTDGSSPPHHEGSSPWLVSQPQKTHPGREMPGEGSCHPSCAPYRGYHRQLARGGG